MTEFQFGDQVRILFRKEMKSNPMFGWNDDMDRYSDTIQIINRIAGHRVYFQDMPAAMSTWAWSTDMIELYEKQEDTENLTKMWDMIVNVQ